MNKMIRLLAASALAVLAARAAEAASTPWQELVGGRARLIAVMDAADGTVSGAIELELADGWKTYWREPGGSGIPPVFDFSRSEHFIAGEVRFPAPQLLEADGSHFAGYKHSVSFPFRGQAVGAAPDGVIALDLLAGICEEICVPATASFSLQLQELTVSDPVAEQRIADSESLVPGEATDSFGVVAARLADPNTIRIEVRVPEPGEETALFAEGPPGWYLTPARRVGDGNLFDLDVTGIPEEADASATALRYTLVNGGRSVEQQVTAER